MSYAMRIAADEGYHAHFLTYHRGIDAVPDDWNDVIAEELFDLISYLRPSGVWPMTRPLSSTVWPRPWLWTLTFSHLGAPANVAGFTLPVPQDG